MKRLSEKYMKDLEYDLDHGVYDHQANREIMLLYTALRDAYGKLDKINGVCLLIEVPNRWNVSEIAQMLRKIIDEAELCTCTCFRGKK